MTDTPEPTLPDDLPTLKAMFLAERAARLYMDLEVERLKLEIARLRHQRFGQSAERSAVLAQLELALEDLEESAAIATEEAEAAAATLPDPVPPPPGPNRKPARRPLPAHLPRIRVVEPAPEACACCGGALHKLGEDVTETLERIPARWQVIQHVRVKFSCRACEKISQPPAPFHPIARGRAGAELLAEVAYSKYGLHLPLHRQSARFAREGVELYVSTLADWIGAVTVALRPLVEAITEHARAGPRIHVDDTPVPVLAKGKTKTGRLWTLVRDDRPFGAADPPAAAYFYSPDRAGAHPEAFLAGYGGIMQADAFSGFNRLYDQARQPAIREAACWAHARRKFFDMARLKKAPIGIEAVKRIDAIFAIERDINGLPPEARLAARTERAQPLVTALEAWLRQKRAGLSSKSEAAIAIDYMLKRWPAFVLFLSDGRVCLSNNAAERAVRGIAVGRKNWTFAGSDTGGHRAAAMYTLIETAKLNDIDPRAWLADVLRRLPGHPHKRVHELLPWNWAAAFAASAKVAA